MSKAILSGIEACAARLAGEGRHAQAEKLLLAAVRKAPGSPELAKMLEKALSRDPGPRRAEKAYSSIIGLPGLCPDNFYHLSMFRKRAGDHAGMRRALERLLAAGDAADPIHRYIACCTLDRYGEAFRTAEKFIGSGRREPVLSRLWNPWGDRSAAQPRRFLADRLAALERERLPEELEHYRSFFRGSLLFFLGRFGDSAAELERLAARGLPDRRYGWMLFPAGWAYLYACDYKGALRMFRRSSRSPISRSVSLGRLAEIYICTGRPRPGFRQFEEAFKTAAFGDLAGLHAWEGQMRLFTGEYKAAVKSLTEGLRLGDDVAYCWRGAAYALQGDLEPALKDLDRAVELFPTDDEALVWRAEVLRMLGRHREALALLDAVIAAGAERSWEGGERLWARVNRALVREALGDKTGMTEDFNALNPKFRKALQAGGPRRPVKAVLEEACRRALGNRRDDRYFFPIWLK